MNVAFIGLGHMGEAMAHRLLDAGHSLAVFNRTQAKASQFAARGAAVAATIGEAARGGVVITMLANDAALEEVTLGPDGLVANLPAGGVHIAMGTHSVGLVRALVEAHAAAGQSLISAPVLGRPEAVTAGRLGIIVAGPADALERCRPLFAAIGSRIFEAGADPAAAATVKIANNVLLACAIEALGEAFALTEKSGVAPDLFRAVVTDGLFASPAYTTYAGLIAAKRWEPAGFSAKLGLKDVDLGLAAGENLGVPMPSASVCRDQLLAAIAHGDGDRDWSVMALQQARASGLV
jgi:3-hydroxyisobutyrate dehydrogenase-like beta-hydroxyacid dehydrogenase